MSLETTPNADKTALQALASQLTDDCPDMRQMAREVAQQVLDRNGIHKLDPDNVYLHRFATASSSPRTYSGWQHFETPFESLTLPQLVMHRFNANDSDNADLLSYLVGFYTDGPDKGEYDERNEVRLDARQVLEYFWSIDFASNFKQRLKAFWAKHYSDFRTLAKLNFLSKVLEACAENPGSALAKCCAEASAALVGGQFWPPSQEQLLREVAPDKAKVRLSALDIGGHVATDILRIVMTDGRQLLYIPSEVDALQLFPDEQALYWWVLTHNNQVENRARFMGHFSLADREESHAGVGLNHLVDLLYQSWGRDDHSGLNTSDLTITGDGFSWLRDKAQQRMQDDVHFSLRSNADLRKQLWIGYLNAFNKVFAPMAAVDWPVALVVVGAGLATTGLNVDQAINGHTTSERRAGVVGAIFAAIDTLFNATFLLGAPGKPLAEIGEGENAVPAPEEPIGPEESGPHEQDQPITPAQLEHWVPRPFWPGDRAQLLAPFETNVIITGEPGTGNLAGVYVQDGQFHVLIDELPYQVRYVGELKTWVIVDPENPFSFYKCQGIRLDADGQWHPVERAGLKGGMLSRLKAWGRTPAPAELPALPENQYEMPPALHAHLRNADRPVLSGDHVSFNLDMHQAVVTFRKVRQQLATDAAEFMKAPDLPPRPPIPEPVENMTTKALLGKIYDNTNGLVIGESHSEMGSKRFLIDNMALLRKMKVKTLYLEHFQTDFQQPDLDVFNRTGEMPEELDSYITGQDHGHMTDESGRYTFRQVLVQAQKNEVRIQSIDCMTSYRQEGQPNPASRQEMMNFYAHRIIQADQALRGPGRWVALVGNTHSNLFEGIPGLAELEGAIGLRVEDAPIGQPDRLDTDPGLTVKYNGLKWKGEGEHFQRVKGDLRLRAGVSSKPSAARGSEPTAVQDFETLLRRPGDYTIAEEAGDSYVINRARDRSLRRTLIKIEGRFIYVEQPDWPTIHERRLQQPAELHALLRARGMRYIS
ncbi:membrane-targeted effector domain-containing toxin [Pseudomonas xanthosomatis]|uniref:membrane-targeted effector domain-containing toxin n=1 Tax=Pseudomonas xanthosomatis TaxID=2842356 RepID=UPI001C3CE5EB|nr:membrane-targeted effector domain-containing toxin [Pseudomonas xanthosomatis]QXH45906.1 membrane-targeted effector domain-containing toxin [Pseudomonas xanthosomatis]